MSDTPTKKGASDELALIRAAQEGDERAFTLLVERYQATVFATVVAIIRDFSGAQALAQEVFLRAWFGLGRLQDAALFAGWLQTIARNRARSYLTWRQRQPLREELPMDLSDKSDLPDRTIEKKEQRRLVLATLDTLPENSRQILLLHYIEDLRTPTIAQQLGITEVTVRQRLYRARQHMQEKMENMMTDLIKEEAPKADFSTNVSTLLQRAQGLFQQVHYREAAPLLEQARELAPEDALVSMLLADAYTFARTVDDLEENREAYDRALALLDEIIEREPENLLAQLRRAAISTSLAPEQDLFAEQRRIRDRAHNTPYEVVAELELARCHLKRMQGEQALVIYKALERKHAWLACVLYSEMGVAYAMCENGRQAIKFFERAAEHTTPKSMATLKEVSQQLIGKQYWAFWSNVDNLETRQCQNYAWLAGLYSACGQIKQARQHLKQALFYLNSDALGDAQTVLKQQFAMQMKNMFPILAMEPQVQALLQEVRTL